MNKRQYLTSLAEVERTQKGKIYKKGTVFIQVSACKRGGEGAWEILKEASALEDKYAVVIPKIEIIPEYFKMALERYTPAWHARYVGTNINISMDAFNFLQIEYTTDLNEQKRYVEMMETVEKAIAEQEQIIDEYKKMKEWYLGKMLSCGQPRKKHERESEAKR